jgi:four helix bundle protein
MTQEEFKERTLKFALAIIELVEGLSRSRSTDVISRQLLRSGTSVGANYRAACRGRSAADMIAKLKIVEEECDETIYWMELLKRSGLSEQSDMREQIREANEILAMTVASIKTLRNKSARGTG